MNFYLISILLFCLAGIYPGFMEYTRKWTPTLKGKYPWIYAWTGESLLFASIAVLLKILNLEISAVEIFAGTTLFVSGFGFVIIVIERLLLLKKERLGTIAYFFYHIILSIIAIWLIINANPTASDFLLSLSLLFLYAAFMIPKGLEVPWILNKKRRLSFSDLKARKRFVISFIMFFYILLPVLSLLV
jgi:hypothetical protein